MHVALHLIINLCGRDLRTGTEHNYRGVLSVNGNTKRALFTRAQALMVERGFIGQEDVYHGQSLLSDEMSQAG